MGETGIFTRIFVIRLAISIE